MELLNRLLPCLDSPNAPLRALVFDKLVCREIWDAPNFKEEAYPRLRAAAQKGRRDKDYEVEKFASDMNWWLDNWEHYRDQQNEQRRQQAARPDSPESMARIRLSFIFGAGVILQTLIFIFASDADNRLSRIAIAAGTAVLGLMPGKHEHHYEIHFHICYCFVIYAVMIFWQFKKEIMARVSESNLLVNSLTLWYLCISFLNPGEAKTTFMALAALPTIGTLIIAFNIRDWSFPVRLSCYVWFLVLTIVISGFQVRFGNMSFIFSDHFAAPRPFSLFLTGMAFTYLGASLFYIYILIPIAGKHETQEHRMMVWREDAHMMASCFADYRMTATEAMQIIAIQGGLYALNYRAGWFLPGTVMNLSMIVLPFVFQLWFRFTERLPTPAVMRQGAQS